MAQFSKKELSFVKNIPKHVEIECPVCLNILTDPHLVSCCGHNFCGSCIERVKASNGSCPMCKEKEYIVVVNKERFRIINGLEVYCSNKEKGCEWKGELKNMSTHLNKEKRKGECHYEEVKCRYEKCQERKQHGYVKYHEDRECPHRPFHCQYCRSKGTFLSITKDHYEECRRYPVPCPNKCVSTKMPRGSLTAHINECPLEPVDCVFSWAGCNDKPLRKDVHVHTADTKHMTLLAVACGQLKKENDKIKKEMTREVDKLKTENMKIKEEMKKENDKLQCEIANIHNVLSDDSYSMLPISITEVDTAIHFYTGACGRHMSARVILVAKTSYFILLAFHEGKFDKFKPKFNKIFAEYETTHWTFCYDDDDYEDTHDVTRIIPLIKDTKASTYKPLPHDILNTIKWYKDDDDGDTPVPEGVIKVKVDIFDGRIGSDFRICSLTYM